MTGRCLEREHRDKQITQCLLLSVPVIPISRGRGEEAHDIVSVNPNISA